MCKNNFLNRLLIVSIACVTFALAATTYGNADTELPSSSDDALRQQTELNEAKVILHKKSFKWIKTYSDDRYAIDGTILVVGEDGRQLLIEHLMVPCEAELLYETLADGSNFVHRIKVVSTHKKASNRMEGPPR